MSGLESGQNEVFTVPHEQPQPRPSEIREPGPPAEGGEGLEGSESAASTDTGYRDRPLSEFREQHPGSYLEPYARPREVEPFADAAETSRRVNPDLDDPSGSYNRNCADCSRAFERGWRGHEEEAAGLVDPGGEEVERLEQWTGTEGTRIDGGRLDEVAERLREGGHGSSAIIAEQYRYVDPVTGEGIGGHAYNAVNEHGSIRYVDAQHGLSGEWMPGRGHPQLDRPVSADVFGWDGTGRPLW